MQCSPAGSSYALSGSWTMPRPSSQYQMRLTMFRANQGFSGAASQRANSTRGSAPRELQRLPPNCRGGTGWPTRMRATSRRVAVDDLFLPFAGQLELHWASSGHTQVVFHVPSLFRMPVAGAQESLTRGRPARPLRRKVRGSRLVTARKKFDCPCGNRCPSRSTARGRTGRTPCPGRCFRRPTDKRLRRPWATDSPDSLP